MICVLDTFISPLQIVHGTLDAFAAPVKYINVNHGGLHVLLAQDFLHGPNVEAAIQDLRGKRMLKGMACGAFGQPRLFQRAVNRLLDDRFVNVMPPLFAGLCVPPAILLRENPLPAPLFPRVGIFTVQGVGQQHAASSVVQVTFVDALIDLLQGTLISPIPPGNTLLDFSSRLRVHVTIFASDKFVSILILLYIDF